MDHRRRHFLVVGGTSAMGLFLSAGTADALAVLAPYNEGLRRPKQIGQTEVDAIGADAAKWKKVDMAHGGAVAREGARRSLTQARAYLEADCSDRLLPQLLSNVGWLCHTVGFAEFDSYHFGSAERLWTMGLDFATQADNHSLQARILGSLARQNAWPGGRDAEQLVGHRPDVAVSRVDEALALEDLSNTEKAMLWSLRARAYAQMGMRDEVLEAIKHGDEFFHTRTREEIPQWSAYYSIAHHDGDTGRALCDLVTLHGHRDLAEQVIDRYEQAVTGHDPHTHLRSKQFTRASYAALAISVGEYGMAGTFGYNAVMWAEPKSSARLVTELETLRDACRGTSDTHMSHLALELDDVLAAA